MNQKSPKVVVLDDYEQAFSRIGDWQWVQAHSDWQVHHQPLRGESLRHALAGVEVLVLMRDRTPLTADLVASLDALKLVVFTGTRNQALDMAALKAKGVKVCHTGWGPSKDSTTELTWALILAAFKHLPANTAALQAGQWRCEHALLPVLRGETLGLLGLGEIGSRVARVATAFGMRVLAWSPNMTPERARQHGAEAASLEEVLAASRIVSLHLVVGPTTRHLINRERLALMRRDALLVNTSRAALVDTAHLMEALQSGQIAQAALDVFDEEPLAADHPLRQCPGLLLTPHLGFVARPVFEQFVLDVQETVTAWLKGEPVPRELA
ncbi:MAG: D-2-hydroxyacid dehydrogenase family protein [Burkholderiaceae bacterium]|nr:D-2-hydroxyacid dehydrogenase family protein [Burkholderiaceae bacterium]